ncbi:LPS export ABC transporter periplasmic protein LptC [Aidingimonas halophila]|uniref:Lipopolysaccharide export system protein LptC n=1 Tax=Aidingimonas halophila TaxID=574349 RepID=A0A1H2QZ41_9GAMM|nr:LPS export ABC transporter periplasmic protein LptC [Aidingimonas halophila]GHC20092.1 hypothetical protein GCM10008094_07850 [Aidingimonas halophila]SDW12140.1 lipopolysaccharide export system protein LptC [Aidingimonas halophila]
MTERQTPHRLKRVIQASTKWWIALLIVALGVLLAVIEQRDDRSPGPVPTDDAGEPDYYLEGVTMTRFDAEGSPHQRLETPRLVHTPDDDTTRSETPRATFLDSEGRTWHGSGETGRLGPGNELLTLRGNARLTAPEEGWQLDTDTLYIDIDDSYAWSETSALLQQPPQRMRGDRFEAWFDDNRMRLTDDVRGHHPRQDRDASEREEQDS